MSPALAEISEELALIQHELAKRSDIALRLRASIVEKLQPLLLPARYKGLHGGRGGMKSWTFARLLLLKSLLRPGTRFVCVREIQNSLKDSVKRLLEDTIKDFDITDRFPIFESRIDTPGGGVIIFQGMQNHTADSIKSLEGFHGAWVEEAQSLSERSLRLLRPTIREENSELWFSWNPKRASDPVDHLLRVDPPEGAIVIETNYDDNPFFPEVLKREMETDLRRDPEQYEHVWRGGYETHSTARVFKNWRVDYFSTPDRTKFLHGADWGFSVDPTVLSRGFIAEGDLRSDFIKRFSLSGRPILCIDREAYEVGCEIDDTPALFDNLDPENPKCARQWEIIADSARPETISYMQRHGYPRIVPARKGAGSVEEGVQFLKSYDIILHTRCVHSRDEFSNYSYKVDPKTEVVLPILDDKKNHVIDADRYMVEKLHKGAAKLTW